MILLEFVQLKNSCMYRIGVYVALCYLTLSCVSEGKKIDFYYPSGEIKSTEFYMDEKYPYKTIDYFANGIVKDTIRFDSEGNRNGVCFFYDSLDLSSEFRHYKRGKLDGWTEIRLVDNIRMLR